MRYLSNDEVEIVHEPVRGGEKASVLGAAWQVTGAGMGGGGKGGSKGKGPKEDPNTLRSRSIARVLYAIGEGEIGGPDTGNLLTSIFLDETVIQNADGTFNFENVTIHYRSGTQGQSYIIGFPNVETEVAVGVKVVQATPITRTITDSNADAIVVRLMTPTLQTIKEKTGDQKGGKIDFKIALSTNGGPFIDVVIASIKGKTTSQYERGYRIPLPKPATTWQVRVTRVTPDSDSNRISNDLFFQAYKQITEAKFRYPNTALLGLVISAEQFRQIPKLGFLARGLLVKIPSNYDPFARIYVGLWNGTWVTQWTNNPAWILYDVLTNPRYGCGKFISESQIDKWSFYAIAQYCDELVPTGNGGFEPRFVCNAYIQSQEDAYDVLNSLASTFRGMLYWSAGTIFATQDRPKAATRLFTEANVIQEVDDDGRVTTPPFTYSGTSQKARHTVALVSWSDPTDFYRAKVEYVEDRVGIRRYGYRETQITAFGCTSRTQARRVGEWLLFTDNYETETITFTVGSEGLLVRPGEIIRVADPLRFGSRRGGRIIAVDGLNITLDSPVAISAANSYALFMVDAATQTEIIAPLVPATGVFTTVAVTSLSATPTVGSVWLIGGTDVQPQLFQVVQIVEKERWKYEITASPYNPTKYDFVEKDKPFTPLRITQLPNLLVKPAAPTQLQLVESLYETKVGVKFKATLYWKASTTPGVERYQVEFLETDDEGEYRVLGITEKNSFEWLDAEPGTYFFRLVAINRLGIRSEYTELEAEIQGLLAPPTDVEDFYVTPINDSALLRWKQHPDLDVRMGGYFAIRFTANVSAPKWAEGIEVGRIAGSSNSAQLPLYKGTYLIKAVDSSGVESTNYASFNTNYISVQNLNFVANFAESPNFLGTKTNTVVANNTLQLLDTGYFDLAPGDFDDLTGDFDDYPSDRAVFAEGMYEFQNSLDLGDIYLSRVTATLSCAAFSFYQLFDETPGNFDDFDGLFDRDEDIVGASVRLQIARSDNGSTYYDWEDFVIGDYLARSLKFRLLFNSSGETFNVQVSNLAVSIDMPDRVESANATTNASTPTTITFGNAFRVVPAIAVSITNAASGDYYVLSSVAASGFQVVTRNSAGTQVARNISWIAKAYGKVTV